MPPIIVGAELKRRDSLLNLVDWLLIDDPEQTVTLLSDPVMEQGVRDRLDQLLALVPALLDVDTILDERFSEGAQKGYVTISTATTTTVYTPAAGKRIRLKWVGISSPSNNSAPNLVEVKFASNAPFFGWDMGQYGGAFSKTAVKLGGVNEALRVTTSAAQTLRFNYELEEV